MIIIVIVILLMDPIRLLFPIIGISDKIIDIVVIIIIVYLLLIIIIIDIVNCDDWLTTLLLPIVLWSFIM